MALHDIERNELITNTCLFLSLYEKTKTEQKKTNIIKCLANGADINARDANNKSNTPAHIAVQIGEKEILQLFIEKGAILNQKNSEGKTPHCLAVEINMIKSNETDYLPTDKTLNHEIIEQKLPHNLSVETNQIMEIEELLRTNSKNTYNKDNLEQTSNENSMIPYFYDKRPGTAGVRGQLYETKLLCLVLIRVLYDKDITKFLLGTNINQLGDLDDICLRYEVKGHENPVTLFLQAKHKEKCEKGKLTVEDLKKNSGDFSLLKYFHSYLKIKEKFQSDSKDPLFVGDFNNINCNFILYTPVKDDFNRKRNQMNQRCIKLNDIIHTNHGNIFQYDYNDEDITFLTKTTVLEQLKVLAHKFLQYVLPETKTSYENMASEEVIIKYHVPLGREVIQITQDDPQPSCPNTKLHHTGKFRSEFFTTSSEFIVYLKDFLYKEISNTHCDKNKIADDQVLEIMHELTNNVCPSTISKAIGKIVTFNENTNKLEIINNKILQKLNDKPEIWESLCNIELDLEIIKQACMIKLESIKFNLPTWFGNSDMTVRGEMSKVKNKLGTLSMKFMLLLNNCNDTKIIDINDSIVGPKKILESGCIKINGGLGGAVGNLLVRDDVTKMLKFDTNNKNLPIKASLFLEELTKLISKEELESYRITINLRDFPKYSFDSDDYDKQQAKDYLDKLWFYTNQADENKAEIIVRKDINSRYNQDNMTKNSFLFYNHAESIFLQSHDKIQKWWKRSGRVRYLDNTNDFFNEAAKLLVLGSTLLVTFNFMYIKKISKMQIEFDAEIIKAMELNKFSKGLVNMVSDANSLSGIKLMQYFEGKNSTFLDFDYILSLPSNDFCDLIKELEFTSVQFLLLMFDNSEDEFIYYEGKLLSEKLKQVIDLFGGIIILVTDNNVAKQIKEYTGDKKYKSIVDKFNFTDLTPISQKIILQETRVYFQDEPMFLLTIIDQKAWGLLRGGLLESYTKGEKIRIGEGLWMKSVPGEEWGWISYLWFSACDSMQRIGATLVRDTTTYYVETLHDIKDNPVVVASTSRIRLELDINIFSYLIGNTKEINSLPWIFRYQHSNDYWIVDENPTLLDSIKVVKILMLSVLTNEIDNIDKLNLIEKDGQIVLRNADEFLNRNSPITIFELELFIYLYNVNQILFYFQIHELTRFNTLNLHHSNRNHSEKRFMLIKALKNRGKRVWIDYAQQEQTTDERLLRERQMYESEFGKPFILVGKHEFERKPHL